MEHNTITNLNQLRIGDNLLLVKNKFFGLVKKIDKTGVWQVMAREDKNGKVALNQVSEVTKKTLLKTDVLWPGKNKVQFIRHTKPVPGEQCFIIDLISGDVFKKPDDPVHNYVLECHHRFFSDVRRVDQNAIIKAGIYAKVVFLKHKKR